LLGGLLVVDGKKEGERLVRAEKKGVHTNDTLGGGGGKTPEKENDLLLKERENNSLKRAVGPEKSSRGGDFGQG